MAAVLAGAVLVLAGSAPAGPPGQWSRLPGAVVNFAEPGLARTADGVLHVLYVRKSGPRPELVHLSVDAAGKVGPDAVAIGDWSSLSHPDLLRMPDGTLRAFMGGIRGRSSGLFTATAPASGRPWTLDPRRAAQSQYAYATSVTGAGLAKDGTPISAWSGTPGLFFHWGLDPADPDREIPPGRGCCLYWPEIAVDAVGGQAWLGFFSLEDDGRGLYANAIGPGGPEGGRRLAPGSVSGRSAAQPGNRTAITGRIGAPGVYLFYGQGYPSFGTLALWRVDTPRPHLLLRIDRNRHANVAAAPEGRLWLVWERSDAIYATRTNKAATRVGPTTRLPAPGGRTVYRLNGEGSAGPLDLFVNDGQGFWHRQVWPRLELRGSRSQGAIVFRVGDAGDPVAGATVKAGGRSLTTNAAGVATLRPAPRGPVRATATKAGYVAASATVR